MYVRMLCPVCGCLVMKERVGAISEVTAVTDGKHDNDAQYAIKCRVCKAELEIKKVG